jgi:hypothetical protein
VKSSKTVMVTGAVAAPTRTTPLVTRTGAVEAATAEVPPGADRDRW